MKGEQLSPEIQEIKEYPRNCTEVTPYVSKECIFYPRGWATINNISYPLAYKIVTDDFPLEKWVLIPDNQVTPTKETAGGIWTALNKGMVLIYKKHIFEEHGIEVRAFLTAMYRPVYANSYRIKSQGVMLLTEIL